MLADLVLTDLPIEALVALKHAINEELLKRKKKNFVQRRLVDHDRRTFQPSDALPSYVEALAYLVRLNAEQLYALPADTKQRHFRDRLHYLPCILAQDWAFLFPTADTHDASFYVYAHVDPREGSAELTAFQTVLKGSPFYIGKGTGRRAWDLKRNQGHGKKLKIIRDAGFPESALVHIIANNLTEQEALVLEAKLIYLLGSIYDETIQGCLVNLADHMRPTFRKGMHKLPTRRAWYFRHQRYLESLQAQPAQV